MGTTGSEEEGEAANESGAITAYPAKATEVQKSPEALRSTQKHSEALRSTQKHPEVLGPSYKHS